MILGIDGGGTKTTAVLFKKDGTFLAQATAGSINTYSNPLSAARENLQRILDALYARVSFNSIESAFIGSSALNCAADAQEIRTRTDGILEANVIGMDSDLFSALETMRCDASCAVAICGTGSMAVGRDADGNIICKGGYGYLLGDEGSGYAISLEAIRAAMRSADGSGPKTALEQCLYDYFQIHDTNELIGLVYDPPMRRQDIAAFLPVAASCAAAGDNVARTILKKQAESFAETVKALLLSLSSDCPVGLWGGVFCHVPYFTEQFRNALPDRTISLLPYPPQLGAVFAAYRQCGIALTEDILARMKSTYPNQDV